MFSQIAVASLLALLPTSAFALPEVTAQALPDGCASYPGYNAATGVAGPWVIQLVSAEDTAIDGFSDTHRYSVSFNPNTDPKPSLRWGMITFPVRNDIAKTPLECTNGTLHARVPTDLTAAGAPTNLQWTPLVHADIPWDATLGWKLSGNALKVFEHYDTDGVKLDGVFLGGYDNSTAWAVKRYAADLGSYGADYYYIRLLGPNSADPTTGEPLKDGESRAFIRVGV